MSIGVLKLQKQGLVLMNITCGVKMLLQTFTLVLFFGMVHVSTGTEEDDGCRSYWIKGEYCPENKGKFYWNNVEGDYCFETGTQTTPEGENVVSCYSGRVFDTWEECKATCFKGPRHHFG